MEDQSGLDGEGEKQDEGLTSLGNLYHKKVSELKKMAKNMGITEKDIDACDDHEDDTKDQVPRTLKRNSSATLISEHY